MKACTKCKRVKALADFPESSTHKGGKYPWCRSCLSQHRKDRYQKRDRKFRITHKTCTRCEAHLPRAAFRTYPEGNLHYRCIRCEDEITFHTELGENQCGMCKLWKPLSQFYPCKRHRHRSQCLTCGNEYRARTKDRIRNRSLQKCFGISLDQYRELLSKQGGRCPVCKTEFENGNYSYPVDHAHSGPYRGRIRGIVHDRCNRGIGLLGDSPEILRAAADYIQNPLTNWIVPDTQN